jgi:hypothetical protein
LPDYVTLRADTNGRNTRDVLDHVNRLPVPERPIEATSPIAGGEVEFLKHTAPSRWLRRPSGR